MTDHVDRVDHHVEFDALPTHLLDDVRLMSVGGDENDVSTECHDCQETSPVFTDVRAAVAWALDHRCPIEKENDLADE